MKNKVIAILAGIFLFMACTDLDLNPLSEASSEAWYTNIDEVSMSVHELYRFTYWPQHSEQWTDDNTIRTATYPITNATISGVWGTVNSNWTNNYRAIARANVVILNLERPEVIETMPEVLVNRYLGNALFVRAAKYSKLIALFGDVVYYDDIVALADAYELPRTSRETVLQSIYDDFDRAASLLPESYGSGENQLATKGAALAMKARIALYMGDWAVTRDAAKAVMDLGVYELYHDFAELFISETKNPDEVIFALPRSRELGIVRGVRGQLPRNHGGWGGSGPVGPSWDLLSAFLCSDGLPIDESPLYNPRKPFENRDPRLAATIVEFSEPFLGIVYEPHPDSLTVMDYNAGTRITNNDTRTNAIWACFNALIKAKHVSESHKINYQADDDLIIMRYADVLLMYAEAKIELGDIDQSVLDAINEVRARAYGNDPYPAVTTTNQTELRKILRMERRMELAFEGRRYMDIIRWRVAETVLNRDNYGMLDLDVIHERLVEPDLWFFPEVAVIDEDGNPDLSSMYEAGLVRRLSTRTFDASKQYLWPIPTSEILINPNLIQNPGY